MARRVSLRWRCSLGLMLMNDTGRSMMLLKMRRWSLLVGMMLHGRRQSLALTSLTRPDVGDDDPVMEKGGAKV